MTRIIGIDASLNSSGCTVIDGELTTFHAFIKQGTIPKKVILECINRGIIIWEHSNPIAQIKNILSILHHTDKIFIEGLSYGSVGNSGLSLAELHGGIKYALNEIHIIPTFFAPTSVKKFFTGKGNAAKSDMLFRFNVVTGLDFPHRKPFEDCVDSYAIASMAPTSLFK